MHALYPEKNLVRQAMAGALLRSSLKSSGLDASRVEKLMEDFRSDPRNISIAADLLNGMNSVLSALDEAGYAVVRKRDLRPDQDNLAPEIEEPS